MSPSVGDSILPPPDVLATWPKPNYVNPQTRSNAGVIFSYVLAAITLFCVVLRLWTRAVVLRNFGMDDWLVTFAVLPLIGLTVVMILLVDVYHFDRHIWDVEAQYYEPAYKLAWLLQLFYVFAVNPAKISILLFYQRLTSHTVNPKFLMIVYGTIIFLVLHVVAFFLFMCLECRPLDSYWTRFSEDNLLKAAIDPSLVKNNCVDEAGAVFGMSVPGILTDLLTTLLPNLLLYNLNMPRSQKWKLAALFAAGYIVTIVGAVRVVYTYKYLYSTWDRSWIGHSVILWTELETCFAVLCTCAPALNALFTRRIAPATRDIASSLRSRTSRRSRATGYTDMEGKAFHSGTATTVTTISSGRMSTYSKPPPSRDIEMGKMGNASIYPIPEAP